MVHTCPRCELRFETEVELSDHLAIDHGVDLPPDHLHYERHDKPKD